MRPDGTSDRLLLEHIRQCMERIRDYTGGRRATSHDSRLAQGAVVRNLQTLAESTQRLGDPLKATEPAVPWSAISGCRNILTRDYLGVDPAIVWSVVEKDLPGPYAAIERMSRAVAPTEEGS